MTDGRRVGARAPAKINLWLRVLAREAEGFHQIETVYAAVDLCDEMEMEKSGTGVVLDVVGADLGPVEQNLVHRAARGFLEAASADVGVQIRLTKHIPHGAGLGGGSSDAGAALRALNVLFGDPLAPTDLFRLGTALGADIPFFVSGAGRALAWGRGERLMKVSGRDELVVLLALPPVRISTGEAYRSISLTRTATSVLLDPADWKGTDRWAELAVNDFEEFVFGRHPELARLRGQMEHEGAVVARLSGSGAALFALFPDLASAQAARASLAAVWSDVGFRVTRTLPAQPSPMWLP